MIYFIVGISIFLTSFLFAMLGLGGGMIYVPILIWANFDPKEVAIPLGLLLNGLNTLLALIPFSKNKLVDWKGGFTMAFTALLFAPIGAYAAKFFNANFLMILFSVFVVIAAVRMLFIAKQPEPEHMLSFYKRSLYGTLVGSIAGFLGGLLGIGGGFIIAPILMWMGYKTKQATATTAFVVTISSFSGFLGHLFNDKTFASHLDWKITMVSALAVLIASQLGATFMTKKAKPTWVKQVYAIALLLIAAKLLFDFLLE